MSVSVCEIKTSDSWGSTYILNSSANPHGLFIFICIEMKRIQRDLFGIVAIVKIVKKSDADTERKHGIRKQVWKRLSIVNWNEEI